MQVSHNQATSETPTRVSLLPSPEDLFLTLSFLFIDLQRCERIRLLGTDCLPAFSASVKLSEKLTMLEAPLPVQLTSRRMKYKPQIIHPWCNYQCARWVAQYKHSLIICSSRSVTSNRTILETEQRDLISSKVSQSPLCSMRISQLLDHKCVKMTRWVTIITLTNGWTSKMTIWSEIPRKTKK